MAELTITEALSEAKLIESKIQKKSETIVAHLCRYAESKDIFESDGGSAEYLRREMQAQRDLRDRLQLIRREIAKANLETTVTVNGTTASVQEWLTWRREIAPNHAGLLDTIVKRVKQETDKHAEKPVVFKDESGVAKLATLVVNVDYPAAIKESELLADTLEKLDGKLSHVNATTTIRA